MEDRECEKVCVRSEVGDRGVRDREKRGEGEGSGVKRGEGGLLDER